MNSDPGGRAQPLRYTLTDPGSSGLQGPVQCPSCGCCYDLAGVTAAERQADRLAWRTPCCDSQAGPPVLVIIGVPGCTGLASAQSGPGKTVTIPALTRPITTGSQDERAAAAPRPVADPAIPAAARRLLTAAAAADLTPASSLPPARPARHSPGTVAALAAAAVLALLTLPPRHPGHPARPAPGARHPDVLAAALTILGHYAAPIVICAVLLLVGVVVTKAALCGYRVPAQDPETPARRAARRYHGRYLTPEDFDPPAAALLARAQHAIGAVAATRLSRDGLLDGHPAGHATAAAALEAHHWDIAQALHQLTRHRHDHAPLAAARGYPRAAGLQALDEAEHAITVRVEALEAYAAETAAADPEYRAWLAGCAPPASSLLDLHAAAAAHQARTTEITALTQRVTAARLAYHELAGGCRRRQGL